MKFVIDNYVMVNKFCATGSVSCYSVRLCYIFFLTVQVCMCQLVRLDKNHLQLHVLVCNGNCIEMKNKNWGHCSDLYV